MNKKDAKQALDKIITKSRVHLYKPIQIAEILYMHRTRGDFDFLDLESYRSISKKWRDDICKELLGRICTSSSKFQELTKSLMLLDSSNFVYEQNAKVYRVGVTNAADRGLDMYSNWGPAIQIKHLTLDEELAEDIVDSISSDKVIIVCKNVNKKILTSIINQIGWRSRIQSIITEENLFEWYEKALRGQYAYLLATPLMNTLAEEMENEFPSVSSVTNTITDRHYENIHDSFWQNKN